MFCTGLPCPARAPAIGCSGGWGRALPPAEDNSFHQIPQPQTALGDQPAGKDGTEAWAGSWLDLARSSP